MVTAAIGLFLLGYYGGNRYRHRDSSPPAIAGVLIRPIHPLPAFELRDTASRPFTNENFMGCWTLLSFGDLHREPDRRAVKRMIEVHNRLADKPDLQRQIRLALVISGDPIPAWDFDRLSPTLRLLSGTAGERQRLQASLGMPVPATTGAREQTPPIHLIDPEGRLLALFPDAQVPATIASDLATVAAHTDVLGPR